MTFLETTILGVPGLTNGDLQIPEKPITFHYCYIGLLNEVPLDGGLYLRIVSCLKTPSLLTLYAMDRGNNLSTVLYQEQSPLAYRHPHKEIFQILHKLNGGGGREHFFDIPCVF